MPRVLVTGNWEAANLGRVADLVCDAFGRESVAFFPITATIATVRETWISQLLRRAGTVDVVVMVDPLGAALGSIVLGVFYALNKPVVGLFPSPDSVTGAPFVTVPVLAERFLTPAVRDIVAVGTDRSAQAKVRLRYMADAGLLS